MANPGEKLGGIRLDLHPAPAPVAALAPLQFPVDVLEIDSQPCR